MAHGRTAGRPHSANSPTSDSPRATVPLVLQPDEVLERLHRRFGDDYADWARGKGAWPLRISLQPPDMAERSESPIACHEWAARWEDYTGPGTLGYANLRFPTGTHRMPKTLVLSRPGDVAAAHPDDLTVWQRCGQRLTYLQKEFPGARLSDQVRRITGLDDADYKRLVRTARWLRANPTSGLLLRQLPIEGIGTKWLGAHQNLVLALLGDDADIESSDSAPPRSKKRALHRRLGLKVVPELVQVTVCDPFLRVQLSCMHHLAATVEDLSRWPHHPTTVVILENKETAFAVTGDHTGTVILHGHGFFVDQYARITWVRNAERVIYWGDIDTAGLQFISDLRALGVVATTILTDTETLDRYRHLAVEGAMPQRKSTPPHLTAREQELYHVLVDHAAKTGTGLLLEQERIPWESAYPRLMSAIGTVQHHA
ncbi:Wadjet anti-phage system protein JetD domain-containing protein [Nocardia sp. CA-107356]|uniref:Wadjet anti-phage system protein JetD domain-containing protein n=1 Tax=Nocardia sp. CA-107356 TaxID=3239972 RepID=UPI003D8C855F